MDVTDEASVDAAFGRVERELGPVQLLVLNAGILHKSPLEEHSLEAWRRVIDVNLTGAFIVARRAMGADAPGGLRPRRGHRLVGGHQRRGRRAAGAAGVCGVEGRRHGAREVDGGRVRAVRDHRQRARADAHRHRHAVHAHRTTSGGAIPVGRYGTPQEVADLAVFLCSGHAGYITGEIVDINGGYLID